MNRGRRQRTLGYARETRSWQIDVERSPFPRRVRCSRVLRLRWNRYRWCVELIPSRAALTVLMTWVVLEQSIAGLLGGRISTTLVVVAGEVEVGGCRGRVELCS